jgi:hypothetical protein
MDYELVTTQDKDEAEKLWRADRDLVKYNPVPSPLRVGDEELYNPGAVVDSDGHPLFNKDKTMKLQPGRRFKFFTARVPTTEVLGTLVRALRERWGREHQKGSFSRLRVVKGTSEFVPYQIGGGLYVANGYLVLGSVVWIEVKTGTKCTSRYVRVSDFILPTTLSESEEVLLFVEEVAGNGNAGNWSFTFGAGACDEGESKRARVNSPLHPPMGTHAPTPMETDSHINLISTTPTPFLSNDGLYCYLYAFENAVNEELHIPFSQIPASMSLHEFHNLINYSSHGSVSFKYKLNPIRYRKDKLRPCLWFMMEQDKRYIILVNCGKHCLGIGRNLIFDCNKFRPFAVVFKAGAEGVACAQAYEAFFGFDIVSGLMEIYEITERPQPVRHMKG